MTRLLIIALLAIPLSGCVEDTSIQAACSVNPNDVRFDLSYLNGPALDRGAFRATQIGADIDSFFIGGPGEPEAEPYPQLNGFSVVSQTLVLGYLDGTPVSYYEVEDRRVSGWGGCRPNLVRGRAAAVRWNLVAVDQGATEIPIEVMGSGCVEESETVVISEIQTIEVRETADSVEILAWVEDRNRFLLGCAGVGVFMQATAQLAEPLGERMIVDGGLVPPLVVHDPSSGPIGDEP